MVRIIAVAALDECIRMVMARPANIPIAILSSPLLVREERNVILSALTVGIIDESKSSPRKSRPKPIRASPMDSFLIFFIEVKIKPSPNNGTAKADILNLKPKKETIQAVIVVPILAPKITPTDCCRVSNPAFTKDTTITVVALDDCIIIVINNPVRTDKIRFPVIKPSIRCRLSPALFWIPSLIIFIPYRRKPRLPISWKINVATIIIVLR